MQVVSTCNENSQAFTVNIPQAVILDTTLYVKNVTKLCDKMKKKFIPTALNIRKKEVAKADTRKLS